MAHGALSVVRRLVLVVASSLLVLPLSGAQASQLNDYQIAKLCAQRALLIELRTKYTDQHPRVQILTKRLYEIDAELKTDQGGTYSCPELKPSVLGDLRLTQTRVEGLCWELGQLHSEARNLGPRDGTRLAQIAHRVWELHGLLGVRLYDCSYPDDSEPRGGVIPATTWQ